MVVCNFFLQGRCRYGEKCWNEHPRGGGRGGGGGGGGQQHSRGEGGFGNRVWVNPSQQKGGYIQPSYFSSHGRNSWGGGGGGGSGGGGGGGGGRRDDVKSSEFSFSTQNRFASLDTSKSFVDRGGRGGGGAAEEDDSKKLEMIQMDMDVWESSGQWGFSCYSITKMPLSGFTDLSPEELRLEYYSKRASGDLQTYINGVNQLLSQWKNRIQELKSMNPSTRAALLAELNGAGPQGPSGGFGAPAEFGSSTSSFGSKDFGSPAPSQTSNFGFPEKRPEFGFISAGASPAGIGSPFGSPSQPPSGFGSPAGSSASTFSFAPPSTNAPAGAPGFGSASAFSFSSAGSSTAGFGGVDGAGATAAAAAGGTSAFPQMSGGFGAASAAPGAAAQSDLFSSESQLTQEELEQFKAKRFTLGQIPLKPPPANLLVL